LPPLPVTVFQNPESPSLYVSGVPSSNSATLPLGVWSEKFSPFLVCMGTPHDFFLSPFSPFAASFNILELPPFTNSSRYGVVPSYTPSTFYVPGQALTFLDPQIRRGTHLKPFTVISGSAFFQLASSIPPPLGLNLFSSCFFCCCSAVEGLGPFPPFFVCSGPVSTGKFPDFSWFQTWFIALLDWYRDCLGRPRAVIFFFFMRPCHFFCTKYALLGGLLFFFHRLFPHRWALIHR